MKGTILLFTCILICNSSFCQSQVEKDLCVPKNDERFEKEYYVLTHSMPLFPNHKSDWDNFKSKQYKKYKLPPNGTKITYASFVVDIDGSIKNLKFLNPPEDLRVIAKLEKVVSSMPKWIPGECDSKVVPVLYNLPLSY